MAVPCPAALPSVPAALAASGVGTWEYDPGLGLTYGDEAFARLFGLSVAECTGGVSFERLLAVLHPDDRALTAQKRSHMQRQGGLFVFEYRTIPHPGMMYWVLVRGRYEKDSRGRVVRGRGIVIDVTESQIEGFGEGRPYVMAAASDENETPLDRAARHSIAARRAIDDLRGGTAAALRPAIDALLMTIGRCLALGGGEPRGP